MTARSGGPSFVFGSGFAVLGVIPTLGRDAVVDAPLRSVALGTRAAALLEPVVKETLIVTAAGRHGGCPYGPARSIDDPELRPVLRAAGSVVIHDPLCPLVPAAFLQRLVAGAVAGAAVVAVRPVTDTIKATEHGVVQSTIPRDTLQLVGSPVIAPGWLLAESADLERALSDLTVLVSELRTRCEITFVTAPSVVRRVDDVHALRLLASIDAISHRVHERD